MTTRGALERRLPPLSVVPLFFALGLSGYALPLAVGASLSFTSDQTNALIVGLYATGGLLCLAYSGVYRMPLLFGYSTPLLLFLATLGDDFTFAELAGATMVGGAAMVLLGGFGITTRVASLLPRSVVYGVIAGSILPFVAQTFDVIGGDRLVVGSAVVSYVVFRRLAPAFPAILPAMVISVAIAIVADEFGEFPGWVAPELSGTRPAFSLPAIVTVVPIFVAMIAIVGNMSGVAYLRGQGYKPDARAIDVGSGLASMGGSLLAPCCVTILAFVLPIAAGKDAGEHDVRHWTTYGTGIVFLAMAVTAGLAADLPQAVPLALLLAIGGLAVVGVLVEALTEVTRGPLRLGPVFAFAIATSSMSLFGLGALFWALVIGTAVSLLLESEALREERARLAVA